ncbi:tautomerase family protein [Streptomyces candidus]|uniref:4-oxalocrotonate tautomerase n=1 Tax=Streptomyces candidus TaxID=67283 RepID=A0A7X0HNB2_9ACTN|nr:tautomerase family protein [Streptomyces candidus]MBB6439507.1 4-oxalocrotonate tautomerase [Streptomyces candidus]
MPHLTIKHFPKNFTPAQERELAHALTTLIAEHFGTPPGAVSISTEAVDPKEWRTSVYAPEIQGRRATLLKYPDYAQE